MSCPTAILLLLAVAAFGAEAPRRAVGNYQVTLRAGVLYAQEESQIEFRIEDLSRPDPVTGFSPVVRAMPRAVINMPAMRGMPPFAETAHAEPAPGDYGIHPTFAHGGEYRLRIAIEGGAEVEFPLTVNDANARRKPVPPRYVLELSSQPKKPRAGEPVALRLVVRDRDQSDAIVTGFETVHEKLLHLIIVRRDLAQFAHEHPAPNSDGSFTLNYRFASGGEYRLFADTAPRGAGGQILSTALTVNGKTEGEPELPVIRLAQNSFAAGKTMPIRMPVDAQGIEPWLGAIGHLILIHEDGRTFVHSHPDDSGTLTFLARFPKAGPYRGWLQYQSAGQLHTVTMTLHAE